MHVRTYIRCSVASQLFTEKFPQFSHCVYITVWKFQDFSITQVLGEIKFWDSRSAKFAISRHLEAQNFNFCGFLHFLKAVVDQSDKIQSSQKWQKRHF